MRLLLLALALLVPSYAARADDAKELAELKKKRTDLDVKLAKQLKEVEAAKAEATAKEKQAELFRKSQLKEFEELKVGEEKAIQARKETLEEAVSAAKKAEGESAEAEKAQEALKEKLKAATDPNEIAELKKKQSLVDVDVVRKRLKVQNSETAVKDAEAQLKKSVRLIEAGLKAETVAMDKEFDKIQVEVTKARKKLVEASDESEKTRVELLKTKEKIKGLEK